MLPFVVSACSQTEDILFAPSRLSLCPVQVVQKVQTKNTDILLNGSNSKNKAENIQKITSFLKSSVFPLFLLYFLLAHRFLWKKRSPRPTPGVPPPTDCAQPHGDPCGPALPQRRGSCSRPVRPIPVLPMNPQNERGRGSRQKIAHNCFYKL